MFAAFWDAKTARVLSTILVFLVVIAFLHVARSTLTLFLFAVLFAYFVDPVVSWFAKHLHGRINGIIATYALLGGVATALGFFFGPRIVEESKSLMASLPGFVDRMSTGEFIFRMSQRRGWSHDRAMQIQQFFMAHREQIINYAEGTAARLEAPLIHLWWLILIPILSVFFLKDARAMAFGVVQLGNDRKDKAMLYGIINDVNVMLGSYIRAQMTLAALTAVVLTLVLALLRVPYIFLFGPLAGVFEFIPVVGPAVACALIFGVAILAGYNHLLVLFLVLGSWRVIQDYVNAPRIMGKSLEISPLVEIFAVLAGGEIGGVIGALVSVPIVAILRIVWLRFSVMKNLSAPVTAVSPEAPVSG